MPGLRSCLPYDIVRLDCSSFERLRGRCDCAGWGICRSQSTASQVRRFLLSVCGKPYFSRVLAQVELDFNSVERLSEYLEVPQEAPAIIEGKRPPAYWPSSHSGITVEDLWVRYSEMSPDVLRGLSFEIKPGEKIGVVGRTGSGKTTLCSAFLRVVEAHRGRIM